MWVLVPPTTAPWPANGSIYGLLAAYDGDSFIVNGSNSVQNHIELCTLALPCMLNIMGQGYGANLTIGSKGSISCLSSNGCIGVLVDSLNISCIGDARSTPILRAQGSLLALGNAHVFGCQSSADGAVVQASDGASVSVVSSSFREVHTLGYGGVFGVIGSRIQIVESGFANCTATGGGGAVWSEPFQCFGSAASSAAEIIVRNSRFENCSTDESGGALLVSTVDMSNESVSVSILSTVFAGCSAQVDGGAMKVVGPSVSAQVVGSSFSSCQAGSRGGAISAEAEAQLNTANVTFQGNTALGLGGGAVYISNAFASLSGLTCLSNTAPVGGGGAVYWEGARTPSIAPDLSQLCNSAGNTAMYGPCIASAFKYLRLGFTDASSAALYYAGIPFELIAVKLDFYNQTIASDSSSVLQVSTSLAGQLEIDPSVSLLGSTVSRILHGIVSLSVILKPTFTNLSFRTGSSSLVSQPFIFAQGPDDQSSPRVQMLSNVLRVVLQNGSHVCPAGYILHLDDERAMSGQAACSLCQPGTYSVDPLAPRADSLTGAPACLNCPAGGNCFQGGRVVTFTLGVWVVSSGMYRLVSCPRGFALTNTTATGLFSHDAQQCGPCLPGYFVLDPLTCALCPAGFYCAGGTAPRAPCPSSTFSQAGANASTACRAAIFLVAVAQLPVNRDSFNAQAYRSALAAAAGVSTDRVTLLSIATASRRTDGNSSVTVTAQIACDNVTMVDQLVGILQSPDSILGSELAKRGLPAASLQSLHEAGWVPVAQAFPVAQTAGAVVGATAFILAALGLSYRALRELRVQRAKKALISSFSNARPGDKASSRHLPYELHHSYEPEKVLGKGAFGCVLQARRRDEGGLVAIKVVLPERGGVFNERELRYLGREKTVLELFTSEKCEQAVHLAGVGAARILPDVCWFVMDLLQVFYQI